MLPPLPCASLPSLLFKIFVGAGGMTALPTKVPCPQGGLGGALFPTLDPSLQVTGGGKTGSTSTLSLAQRALGSIFG